MLLRYLHCRILTRLLVLLLNCFMPALLAPLLSILIKPGFPLLPMALARNLSAAFLSRLAVGENQSYCLVYQRLDNNISTDL